MSWKKKFGMGVVSAALGLALVGEGTIAYYNDTEVSNNTFATGTLDLALKPKVVVNVKDLKPGDSMFREFKLVNKGSLDIHKIELLTAYEVKDKKKDNGVEDLGEHIRVNFLYNEDKDSLPIESLTLKELKEMSDNKEKPDVTQIWDEMWEKILDGKLKAGTDDTLYVEFEFVDNEENQNIFQGDSLKLDWTFIAEQGAGEEK